MCNCCLHIHEFLYKIPHLIFHIASIYLKYCLHSFFFSAFTQSTSCKTSLWWAKRGKRSHQACPTAADCIVSVPYSYVTIKDAWKMTMTITRSPISLHSKVSHFRDCNNHSQNKITHSNRAHNVHPLRQGVTFAVCTEELVVSSGVLVRSAHVRASVHGGIKGRHSPHQSIWKTLIGIKVVGGPRGIVWPCGLSVSRLVLSKGHLESAHAGMSD